MASHRWTPLTRRPPGGHLLGWSCLLLVCLNHLQQDLGEGGTQDRRRRPESKGH